MMVETSYYLVLAALIFTVGATGVLLRRNALIIFMCIEMMLNSVNLTLIALARQWGDLEGQIFVFMIMAVAAAEGAVGLAILIANGRHRKMQLDARDRVPTLFGSASCKDASQSGRGERAMSVPIARNQTAEWVLGGQKGQTVTDIRGISVSCVAFGVVRGRLLRSPITRDSCRYRA